MNLNEFILSLLLTLQSEYGINEDIDPPQVHLVSSNQLIQMACISGCDEVRGWTPPGVSIYLDYTLDFQNSIHDQSILLHELVHYVQYKYGLDEMSTECLTWKLREAKAYQFQIKWLHDRRQSIEELGLHRVQQRLIRLKCPQ